MHVSQPETLSVQTTALMMQALWSGSMTLALLHYIQAFAEAIRCPIEELLVYACVEDSLWRLLHQTWFFKVPYPS